MHARLSAAELAALEKICRKLATEPGKNTKDSPSRKAGTPA
jgi:hypothetical protein